MDRISAENLPDCSVCGPFQKLPHEIELATFGEVDLGFEF
jgi:hypothetical protein